MCLAIPGNIIRWIDRDPVFGKAEVEFDGVRRVCGMACVPEAEIGDYVLVHAGIAISRIDSAAAAQTLRELHAIGESTLPDQDPDREIPR